MGKKKIIGEEAFDSFYEGFYQDRWASLKKALKAEKSHCAYLNPFSKERPVEGFEVSSMMREGAFFSPPKGDEDGLYGYYLLDMASVFAPLALDVKPNERVLDLCAAPGGKSLILAYALSENAELVCNDRSRDRRGRLKKVLTSYLPSSILEKIKVTAHDSSSWCLHEKEAYDKILLDAPCSSERHVLKSPEHLKNWKPARTKKLSQDQWTMLASAFQVLKTGGRLVYSTCSISPLENDNVVSKLKKKFSGEFSIIDQDFEIAEKTQFGSIILPDRSNWGPFYLSIIQKL